MEMVVTGSLCFSLHTRTCGRRCCQVLSYDAAMSVFTETVNMDLQEPTYDVGLSACVPRDDHRLAGDAVVKILTFNVILSACVYRNGHRLAGDLLQGPTDGVSVFCLCSQGRPRTCLRC